MASLNFNICITFLAGHWRIVSKSSMDMSHQLPELQVHIHCLTMDQFQKALSSYNYDFRHKEIIAA